LSKLREKIERILQASETDDLVPPYRVLPKGHNEWVKIKSRRILEAFREELPEAYSGDDLTYSKLTDELYCMRIGHNNYRTAVLNILEGK